MQMIVRTCADLYYNDALGFMFWTPYKKMNCLSWHWQCPPTRLVWLSRFSKFAPEFDVMQMIYIYTIHCIIWSNRCGAMLILVSMEYAQHFSSNEVLCVRLWTPPYHALAETILAFLYVAILSRFMCAVLPFKRIYQHSRGCLTERRCVGFVLKINENGLPFGFSIEQI